MRRCILALVLIVGWALPARAGAVVQFKSQGFLAADNAHIVWTLTGGNAVGVVITVTHSLFFSISSVSDGVNTWTAGCSTTGGNEDLYTYYAKNITGTSNDLVVTLSGGATFSGVFAYETSGADTTAPLDGNVCGTTSGTDLQSPALTTTAAGVVMTVGAMFDSGSTPWAAGTTYSAIDGEGYNDGGVFVAGAESKVSGAAISAVIQHITANTTTAGVIGVIAFKDAGGGGTPSPCQLTLLGVGKCED